MEQLAGWLFLVGLAVVNLVVYILIDGYFEGDIEGVQPEKTVDK